MTKSGIILGLGETEDEVVGALADLRGVGVDIVTIGQYLRPTATTSRSPAGGTPTSSTRLRATGDAMGFGHVEASPLTRSSYHAQPSSGSRDPRHSDRRQGRPGDGGVEGPRSGVRHGIGRRRRAGGDLRPRQGDTRDGGRRHRSARRSSATSPNPTDRPASSPRRSSVSVPSTSSSPTPAARRRPARSSSTSRHLAAALNANLTTSVPLVRAAVEHMRRQGMGPHLPHHVRHRQAAAARPSPCRTPPGPDCGLGPRPQRSTWPARASRSTSPAPACTPPTASRASAAGAGPEHRRPGRLRQVVAFLCSEPARFVSGQRGAGRRRVHRRPVVTSPH